MRYNVLVKTGAKRERVEGGLVVYVSALPVDGKANDSVIRLLAKHFNVAKSCVTIYRGIRSNKKIVDVFD